MIPVRGKSQVRGSGDSSSSGLGVSGETYICLLLLPSDLRRLLLILSRSLFSWVLISDLILPSMLTWLVQALLSISFTLLMSASQLIKNLCISYYSFLSLSSDFLTYVNEISLRSLPADSCNFLTMCLLVMSLFSLLAKKVYLMSFSLSRIQTPTCLTKYQPCKGVQVLRWIRWKDLNQFFNPRRPSEARVAHRHSQGRRAQIFPCCVQGFLTDLPWECIIYIGEKNKNVKFEPFPIPDDRYLINSFFS